MSYIGGLTKNELKALISDELSESKREMTELRKEIKELKDQLHSKSKELLTIKDLELLFSVGRSTIHNWVKEGKLIKYKIGGRAEFKKADVEKLINYSKQ